jgi:hypothetical protein
MLWRSDPVSFFCMLVPSCLNASCWKRLLFPHRLVLHPCLKSIDYKCEGLFLALHSILLTYMSVPMLVSYCLDYCNFLVGFEIGMLRLVFNSWAHVLASQMLGLQPITTTLSNIFILTILFHSSKHGLSFHVFKSLISLNNVL